MDGRMRQIRSIIEDAEIVESVDTSAVNSGSVVTIRYEGDEDTETYLVGSVEERREGLDVVSPTSPLGTALVSHKVGDVVEYQAPGGRLRVEIINITA
jgi:transcription elongation factor GreA